MNFDDLAPDLDIPEFINTHNTALRFPDKLMLMLIFIERECARKGRRASNACATWTLDGRAFVIHNQEELVKTILPRIFQRTKFSSFTRKLYRWGFRQVFMEASSKKTDQRNMIFANENFQRDNKHLMANMRSTTAEGARRESTARREKGSRATSSTEQTSQSVRCEPSHLSPSSSNVSLPATQVALPDDLVALLASSQPVMPQQQVSSVLPTQPMFQSSVGDTTDLPPVWNRLPFLTSLGTTQQPTLSATAQQNSLVASLLMSELAREQATQLSTQQLLLPRVSYAADPNLQTLQQSALAAYIQQQQQQQQQRQQQDQGNLVLRQLLDQVSHQSNLYRALALGQDIAAALEDNRHAETPRDASGGALQQQPR